MNKFEQLKAAIQSLPDQYNVPRAVCLNLLENGELQQLRTYSIGLRDMAYFLTTDEALLKPLTHIRELLP